MKIKVLIFSKKDHIVEFATCTTNKDGNFDVTNVRTETIQAIDKNYVFDKKYLKSLFRKPTEELLKAYEKVGVLLAKGLIEDLKTLKKEIKLLRVNGSEMSLKKFIELYPELSI